VPGLAEATAVAPADWDAHAERARATLLQSEGLVSAVYAPIIAKGRVKGVLEVLGRRALAPGREWLGFLEALAGQAAIAMDNAQLFEGLQRANLELSQAYDATIEGWSYVLELRDHETQGHTRRVTDLAVRLARAVGVPEADLVHVRRGALLHDIGKLAIPDAILLKPGPLTPAETEIMRQHPGHALRLLGNIPFLQPALDIPAAHHEWWNGSGYPAGLAGEVIPLAARVFAIVDVWDALRSDRPYRRAWPESEVHAYLRAQSGTQFDPRVVAAMFELLGS
jgi:putative nucleotidyltransferase with HDIG domain